MDRRYYIATKDIPEVDICKGECYIFNTGMSLHYLENIEAYSLYSSNLNTNFTLFQCKSCNPSSLAYVSRRTIELTKFFELVKEKSLLAYKDVYKV